MPAPVHPAPPAMPRPSGRRVGPTAGQSWRGSVLVIVLVTLMFAVTALLAFVERAGDDLLVEARVADATRLRAEAYSAFETTLAVLEDFRLAGGALRSPLEGWADPLSWIGYTPPEGTAVEVRLVDESGKLPLPNVEHATLAALFVHDGLTTTDAERLADALLGWIRPGYVPTSVSAPRAEDYERAPLPFAPAGRSLRSFSELASIDVAREVFYDETGRPTEQLARFADAVSLYAYPRPNVNAAPDAVLAAVGNYTETQRMRLADYFAGTGSFAAQGPGYLRSAEDAAEVFGEQAVADGFAAQVRALRIVVTVRQGHSSFQLNALVAPPGGARIIVPPAEENDATNASSGGQTPAASAADTGAGTAPAIDYPFTFLEITENAAMSLTPPVADDETN